MSGIFGDLDVAGAEDLSTGIPDGVYPAEVTGAEVVRGTKNSPDGVFLVISYTVDGYEFPVKEFKSIPQGSPATWDNVIKDNRDKTEAQRNKTSLSFLKARLESLGVPPERMNTLEPEYLIGTRVVVTLKKNPQGYSNVQKVAQPADSGITLPAATEQPALSIVRPTPPPAGNVAALAASVANPFAKK